VHEPDTNRVEDEPNLVFLFTSLLDLLCEVELWKERQTRLPCNVLAAVTYEMVIAWIPYEGTLS
jgi:hypothetical protein